MVIQSTADTAQVSVPLLTTITALLLAAASVLLSKGKHDNGNPAAGGEPEE